MIYYHLFDVPVEDISHYNVPLVWTTRYLVDHAPSCIMTGIQRGFFLIRIFEKDREKLAVLSGSKTIVSRK